MTIFNFGSIVIDNFYKTPRIPIPGESVRAESFEKGLGGKGANQSIAAKKAGSDVFHIGAVGPDGNQQLELMKKYGIDIGNVNLSNVNTGHANITIDPSGENAITFYAGANDTQTLDRIEKGFDNAKQNDICLLQNEVNLVFEAAKIAKSRKMKVIYSAAPFDISHVRKVINFIDLLVVNETEHALLLKAFGRNFHKPLLITQGSKGSCYISSDDNLRVQAPKVHPVDTTGAGDTYLGYFASTLDQKKPVLEAMEIASFAAALQVTQYGTSEAIPDLLAVKKFWERSGIKTLTLN